MIGWVDAQDLSTHVHMGKDKNKKEFTINGNEKAFNKAWGGSNNLVYNLSDLKGEIFKVNLTETVGNNTWYRGKLKGKTVWIHSSYLINESQVSQLGHLLNGDVKIYSSLLDQSEFTKASSEYTNAVYYMKKKSEINGKICYLISASPSSTQGVIGRVNSKDLSLHSHVGVNKNKQTLYVKGTGKAYSKAWGGSKDLVYNDLSNHKDQKFQVNLTERVGNNVWYRGTLNGKRVWLYSSYVFLKKSS